MATELFSILTYEFSKVENLLDIPETYTPVISVTQVSAAAGVYEMGFSIQGAMADTNDSAYLRFRVNGGTWSEFVREAQDSDDTYALFYQFPKDNVAIGDLSIEVEMRKEDAGAQQLDVYFADAWIRRVK